MLTRTRVKSRIERKTNPALAAVIKEALKQKSWFSLAKQLSSSTRTFPALNLSQIDTQAKDGAIMIIPGKVLGSGTLTKKISLYALSFSSSASDKLSKAKVEHGDLLGFIQKNQKAGVMVLR